MQRFLALKNTENIESLCRFVYDFEHHTEMKGVFMRQKTDGLTKKQKEVLEFIKQLNQFLTKEQSKV